TADLLHAMQALSQLSYTPVERGAHYKHCSVFVKHLAQLFLSDVDRLFVVVTYAYHIGIHPSHQGASTFAH
ncbi:MAG: hypothetical protein JZU45_12045, partial [Methyloversatilis discipulorum]|uniref:hypothetical protein n=1 Tax=Methyloversatilis discipulorum TaxID=1119528 RepID=UPI0026E9FEE4